MLRYGINQNAEIRIQTDYARVKTDCTSITGFNPLIIGSKILITEQKGILPQTSVMLNLVTPKTGKEEFSAESLTPSLYLLMQHNITDKFNICYNAGLEYDGVGPVPAEFAALCFGYGFTNNLSGFVENYNWFANNTKPQNYLDLGCAFLIGKNLQIDLSGNMSLQDIENYYMVNFGIAWRIMK